jgi:hypothetical protein
MSDGFLESLFNADMEQERRDDGYCRFKGHTIRVERENPESDWYITVEAPDGTYAYDGSWRDSAHETADEAIEEAKRGALL